VRYALGVTIYFVDIEPDDEAHYGEVLAEHDLMSVRRLAEVGGEAEVVCVFIDEPLEEAFLAAHPRLRFIATRSTSTDHIDLPACARRGVLVSRVVGYSEVTVAEHVFALMLALARRLRELMTQTQGTRFSYPATRGFELHGKTLGLIGMGRVGRHVAELARAFRMNIIAHDIETPAELARELHFEWVSLEALFARADIISLHAPLTAETYHLVNAQTLERMKRGVLLINTARGALVDTAALRSALESGHVGGAGLDVLQDERVLRQHADQVIADNIVRHLRSDARASEARDADRLREIEELMFGDALLAQPNVVFTPHVAFNTREAARRLTEATAANIRAFLDGEPHNLVKAP